MASSIKIQLEENCYTSLSSPKEPKSIYTTPLDSSYECYKTQLSDDKSSPFQADTGTAVIDQQIKKNKARNNPKKRRLLSWSGAIVGALTVISIASIAANVVLVLVLYNKIPWAGQCNGGTVHTTTTNKIVVENNTLLNATDLAQGIVSKLQASNDQLYGRLVQEILQNNQQTKALMENNTDVIEESTMLTLDFLTNITNTLSNIEISNYETSSDILTRMEELLVKNELTPCTCNATLPGSCQDIQDNHPGSPSGYYSINGRLVYCEMGELCGSEGGWTRLAYLNMSDPCEECPLGFELYETNNVRACGRTNDSDSNGCASVQFPSHGISYSEVCGRVVGYQYGSPDGFNTSYVPSANNINSSYVDGVSITHGNPHQHVWTLMAIADGICPCRMTPPHQNVPSFVGNNYFCESGNSSNWEYELYTDDPLWDGEGCGSEEGDCCIAPGFPWFHKTLRNTTTTDYLELRVCGDQEIWNEDVPVSVYEIYVK